MLASLGARQTVPALIDMLSAGSKESSSDVNPNLIRNIVECLGHFRDRRAAQPLADFLTEHHVWPYVTVPVAETLLRLGGSEYHSLLRTEFILPALGELVHLRDGSRLIRLSYYDLDQMGEVLSAAGDEAIAHVLMEHLRLIVQEAAAKLNAGKTFSRHVTTEQWTGRVVSVSGEWPDLLGQYGRQWRRSGACVSGS